MWISATSSTSVYTAIKNEIKNCLKKEEEKNRERVNFAYIRTSLELYFFLFRAECLYKFSDILWLIVCPYTSLGRVCFSLSLWISVVVIGYIVIHCMCLCPSLGLCFSLSLTLSMPIGVFGYIVTDCSSIGTSLDRRIPLFFPSLCLSQCTGILSVSLRVYVRPLIHICFSLILCKCIYDGLAILSLIVGVYVRLLIRISLSVSLKVSITDGL